MKTEENYSLLAHNTFGIEARCRLFAEYETPDELAAFLRQEADPSSVAPRSLPLAPCPLPLTHSPVLHIGGGSNLLLLGDYDGLVLHSAIRSIEELPAEDDGTVMLRVGAGVVWDDLVTYTLEHGWYGLENLSLIPGEVGASAVQNIGAYGAEAKDFIVAVECMNLQTQERRVFTNADCQYAYRQSLFKTPEERGRWAVLYVTYRLSRTLTPRLDYGSIRAELERQGISPDGLTALQLRNAIVAIRRAKLPDPKVEGNAGSFFMNPVVPREVYEALALCYPDMPHYDVGLHEVKIPAGWLIEQCGWKGRSLGPAGVHARQALVLVNRGGATGQDIVNLCDAICRDVREQFGIQLCPEANFVGGKG
ncbi:MAG: UDP-N-acetylmuramate dehydrogenase [Bacteroidaceae bacterium]|nr:UDP-N-acetylmuramate dehydrogenase [Bacteroidaceae bacterium]